jgi:hypothetical protein
VIALSCMSLHCTICLLWFVYRLNTFRLSAIMSSSICIVAEAMDAYRSFIRHVPVRMESFTNQAGVIVWKAVSDSADIELWIQDYLAAHPVAWWNVGEAKIVTLLSGLPLTHETKDEMVHMVRCLVVKSPKDT